MTEDMHDSRREQRTVRRGDSLRLATASRALPLGVGYGLNLLATPIIASSLGLAQFGLWALTGAVAQYGSLLDLGVSRSVTRFTALQLAQDDERAADRVVWTAGALVTSVCLPLLLVGLLAAPPLAAVIGFPDESTVRAVIGASLVILVTGQLCTILTGAAYGREFQALPNAVIAACGLIGNCIGAAAAFLSGDVVVYAWAAAGWNVVTLMAIAAAVHTRIARLRPARPSWATLRELASFGLKGQSLLIAELLIIQLTKVLLGVVSGAAAAGAYELGSRLALGFRTLGGLFTGALTAPFTRSFSEQGLAGAREHAERLTTRVVALSIVPPLLGLALAPAFLDLWLGRHEALTLAAMTALCLAFTADSLTGVQGVVADAVGRPGLRARAAIVTAVLSLCLSVPLLLLVGPLGLLAGVVVAILLGSAYSIALIQPAVGSTQTRYYRLIGGPLILGTAATVLASLSTAWLRTDTRLEAAVTVAVGSVVFLGFYFSTAVMWGHLPRHYFSWPLR
jgi:O-antigen/teichoic acid export membrane protein